MRIAVFSATQRGYRFLEALFGLSSGHEIVVFSFPEDPWEPPFLEAIQTLAKVHGSHFFQTRRVDSADLEAFWQTTEIDLMLAVSWRYLIPASIYQRARLGAFVFHDSLLPQYRGFAPTVWAMINGEEQTGVTLFEMSERVDAGPIVDQQTVPIAENDTIASLMARVTETYLDLLRCNFKKLIAGTAPRLIQDESKATYTCKRLPEDNQINWHASSRDIYNLIRAVSPPYPGAFTYLEDQRLYILKAKQLNPASRYVGCIPGRVAEIYPNQGVVVLTGNGALMLTEVRLDTESEVVCPTAVLKSLKYTLSS